MKQKTIRAIGTGLLVMLWAALVLAHWFGPKKETSAAERRALAGAPELTAEALLDGSFMTAFEDFAQDQFPLRDTFRSVKAVFHTYVLGAKDNNGYYYQDGYLAKQELTLDQEALEQKLEKLNGLYGYLNGQGNYYLTLVPDKSYYLAEKYGYPSLDHSQLESLLRQELSWAKYIDITETLELEDYYHTDTHWRQEKLLDTAQALCQAMGGQGPQDTYTPEKIEKPFYGVYYAQAALPVSPDEMWILNSPTLENLKVSVDGAPVEGVYNRDKLDSEDAYNIYLSGAKTGFVEIQNPNARTEKTLLVIRDSFGSSIGPLLVEDYAKVILVDLRVFPNPSVLPVLVGDLDQADVLVMLSALSLNNTEAFR